MRPSNRKLFTSTDGRSMSAKGGAHSKACLGRHNRARGCDANLLGMPGLDVHSGGVRLETRGLRWEAQRCDNSGGGAGDLVGFFDGFANPFKRFGQVERRQFGRVGKDGLTVGIARGVHGQAIAA